MEPLPRKAFRNTSAIPTTPSAPLRWLRIFFLMAQPPLLYQEGNCQPQIHSQLLKPPEDYLDRLLSKEGWLRLNKKIPFLSSADGEACLEHFAISQVLSHKNSNILSEACELQTETERCRLQRASWTETERCCLKRASCRQKLKDVV
jgi:hypothetical protein